MHHTQSWWNYHHLDNILSVHFNDMLREMPNEILRVARFLDIPISDEAVAAIVPVLSLEAMRRNGQYTLPAPAFYWKDGPQTFFYSGTNGRWRDLLTHDELAMYEDKGFQGADTGLSSLVGTGSHCIGGAHRVHGWLYPLPASALWLCVGLHSDHRTSR